METGDILLMLTADTKGHADSDAVQALIIRAKQGDIHAFEKVMTMHQRMVFATALQLVGNPDDAMDAAQETFLRMFRFISRYDLKRPFKAWLYRITVNVCRDMSRKKNRAQEDSLETVAEEKMSQSGSQDYHLTRASQREILREGLKTLSHKERSALVLRDIEGLSTAETAKILGSSETTVRSQISRARVKIKKFSDLFIRRRQ